jgi:chondroitin 4-sulfotransferase 11
MSKQNKLIKHLTAPKRHGLKTVRAIRHRFFDDFEFIHINKTGGSSVDAAMKLKLEHRTVKEKIAQIGREKWDRQKTFSIVRNPWDKVVSQYHYRIQTNQNGLGKETMPFDVWLKHVYRDQHSAYLDKPRYFLSHVDWLTDESDQIAVDEVLRFENLNKEFSMMMEKWGRKGIALPHMKASQHRDYREYYTPELAGIVATWFAGDLDAFDYSFEERRHG